jgi:hypothetical protein
MNFYFAVYLLSPFSSLKVPALFPVAEKRRGGYNAAK